MLVAYAAALVAFLGLDAVWLTQVIGPEFEATVPHLLAEDPNLLAAALFYLGYVAGVTWFAVRPGVKSGLGAAALNGFLLGLVAYGCYEFTNLATLEGWTWRMLAMDTVWGGVVTAVAAVVGAFAARRRASKTA